MNVIMYLLHFWGVILLCSVAIERRWLGMSLYRSSVFRFDNQKTQTLSRILDRYESGELTRHKNSDNVNMVLYNDSAEYYICTYSNDEIHFGLVSSTPFMEYNGRIAEKLNIEYTTVNNKSYWRLRNILDNTTEVQLS